MVGQNHNKYHGGGICCIVIYYGILYNIGILRWDEIWDILQWIFSPIFRFFRFIHFVSLSAWRLLFIKLHETLGHRQTSMALTM